MQINITEAEAEVLIILKKMLRGDNPPCAEFLEWVASRLVNVYKESPNMDYVQALRQYATDMENINRLLKK